MAELSAFFAAHDRWLFGHTARGKLVAGLERYYPFGRDDGKGAAS